MQSNRTMIKQSFDESELLDEINIRIIEGLMNNKTQEEIAEQLEISTKTVYNRMKVLEENGYIKEMKKGVWVVDYKKIGLDTIGVVLIALHNDQEGLAKLIDHLNKMDYVENVFEIVGSEYNLCIIVRFKGLKEAMEENNKFLKWMNKHNIKIDRMSSFIAGKTHKDHRRSKL
ncbi:transcriptional regulator [Archaeoglobales archaeon]|nr:MAG: transcriptional regulator [Archaeoglobales archaeon]